MENQLLNIAIELKEMVIPAISFISVMVFIKQPLEDFFIGIRFYLGKTFNNDDMVYIDNDKAIIKRIDIFYTHFELLEKSNGIDRIRVVPNHRIGYLKLEKIIDKD